MADVSRIEITDMKNIHTHPCCPHGPTIRFRRVSGTRKRDYFACSACRSRKDCNFFLWADEKITESKVNAWNLEKERMIQKIDSDKCLKKLKEIEDLPRKDRGYCHACCCLFTSSEFPNHSEHSVTLDISDYQLRHPTQLLKPLGNAKLEAQYLFTGATTNAIISALLNLGARNILCMGTPRLHEVIQSEYSGQLDSLLLDIDNRYLSFYEKSQFCWFNCFNNYHFNGKASVTILREFLGKGDVILVTDPPFGGRVEPLAYTIQEVTTLYSECVNGCSLRVMWIFPYFMEPQILTSCPDYSMLDYKVDYDNHPLFTQGPKGRKYGSPVRIFTNIEPKLIRLPKEEGYKYCSICERWVSSENKHCKICNKCTSKDGRTYVHCSECGRCVKPSWKHCSTCERCCIQSHVCGEFQPSKNCFLCGVEGHKKSNCPLRDESFQIRDTKIRKKKRKNNNSRVKSVKKMKVTK